MTHCDLFVGIDVAKAHLDVHLGGDGQVTRYANDPTGLTALILELRSRRADGVTVALEASGGWEKKACRALHAAGMTVRRVSPDEVRAFAKAKRQHAKTDSLDARLLTEFAAMIDGPAYQPEPALEPLRELLKARAALMATVLQLDQRRAGLDHCGAMAPLAEIAGEVRRKIATLDTAIQAALRADPALKKTFRLLLSIPGIGPQSAAMLIARLPEINHLSAKQLAALVGVAPHPRQSGTRDAKRHIGGGRRDVRRVLFMAATVASRHHPDLCAFYQRLRAAGKAHKVAVVAVINKLLAQCKAVVARQTPWQANAPEHA